ncbi:MAG: NAD(P)-binding protein [Actinobacteria bacterium]|nr:NAD(P)-binding protein [Actinomycetota bacterium]
MAGQDKVAIYGAGMSGLVAAIDLARHGYEVTVHDREEGFGGDGKYNPSTHTTSIDVERTSEYIGIDLSPVFHPLVSCPFYFHETVLHPPLEILDLHTVERGSRPTSLDSLLYAEAARLGVGFRFNSPLRREDLPRLPENTIIACGLTPSVYEMLGLPYLRWYGWASRGEIGFSNRSWIWIDEAVTEYGYLSSCNDYYFDFLFSKRHVDEETLHRYRDFMLRHQGVENHGWHYISGAVPLAATSRPRLFHRGLILCGTISGSMDPFFWFGILGALVTGKVAAMAVYDRSRAAEEFNRFNRNFSSGLRFKNRIWYRIRPHVDWLEWSIRLIGPERVRRMMAYYFNRHHFPFNLPGFARLGVY